MKALIARVASLLILLTTLAACDRLADSGRNFAVRALAEEVNKQTPMMVDQQTEFFEAVASDSQLQYHYRLVNYAGSEINTEHFKDNMRKQLRETTCNNKDLKPLLTLGASVSYHYFDKDKQAVADFAVTPDDCGASS